MTSMIDQLKTFANRVAGPLDGMFADQGQVTPMWFLEDENGDLHIYSTPWADDREKNAAVRFLRTEIKAKKGVRLCHLAEVWQLTGNIDDGIPESIKLGGKIASHPDRREAVIVLAQDKDGNHLMITRYILRPEHKPPVLSPAEERTDDPEKVEGLLTHLFA